MSFGRCLQSFHCATSSPSTSKSATFCHHTRRTTKHRPKVRSSRESCAPGVQAVEISLRLRSQREREYKTPRPLWVMRGHAHRSLEPACSRGCARRPAACRRDSERLHQLDTHPSLGVESQRRVPAPRPRVRSSACCLCYGWELLRLVLFSGSCLVRALLGARVDLTFSNQAKLVKCPEFPKLHLKGHPKIQECKKSVTVSCESSDCPNRQVHSEQSEQSERVNGLLKKRITVHLNGLVTK